VLWSLLILWIAATGPSSLAQSSKLVVAPSSGKALCSALTPGDFNNAGLPVTRIGAANIDGPASADCVYESKGAKVEFDIFFPAGSNIEEVDATERTVIAEVESDGKKEAVKISKADHAHFLPAPINKRLSIVVRKGSTVFNIDVPDGPNARQQLTTLAELVLSRLKQ
jgi:hypothetical protein